MKIPFTLDAWLKDKSRRVETRDGRVVHNIWRVKEPFYTNNRRAEVCALIDGEEDALVFFEGGRYLPTTKDTDSPFDLFIITPEPELSEFEDKLRIICENAVKEAYLSPGRTSEEFAKNHAAELLSLARDQFIKDGYVIEKKAFHDAVEKVAPEVMNEVSENIGQLTEFEERIFKLLRQYKECDIPLTPKNIKAEASMLWPDFEKYFFDLYGREGEGDSALRSFYYRGLADGKAEALNDLPRWKRITLREDASFLGCRNEDELFHKGRVIALSKLEKLPGFNE